MKNYGNKKQEVRANLIVCEGQLVGGDVCSAELDGFMQGLRKSRRLSVEHRHYEQG